MKTQTQIKVNGATYPIKFGYGAIQVLGGFWGLDGFTAVVNKVGSLVPADGVNADDLKFETLNCLGDVMLAGIINGVEDSISLTREDCVNAFFSDMEILKVVFEEFMKSMPKVKQPSAGKRQASKKPRRKN